MNEWVWRIGQMIPTGETEVLGMSPNLHTDRQVTDCLSHVTTKLPTIHM